MQTNLLACLCFCLSGSYGFLASYRLWQIEMKPIKKEIRIHHLFLTRASCNEKCFICNKGMPWEALGEVVQRQGSPQAHGVKSFTGLCSWSFRWYLSRERLSLPALPSWKVWQFEPLSVCRNSKIGTFKLLLDKRDQSEEKKKCFLSISKRFGWADHKKKPH